MRHNQRVGALGCIVGLLLTIQGCGGNPGVIHVDRWAEIKADDRTVADILTAFNRAERAIKEQNLDALMDLYSDAYRYHGLGKDDLRKIWSQTFAQYGQIYSFHTFYSIIVNPGQPPTADLVCTGYLRGFSKETGWRMTIDKWALETHHLVFEHGGWRIRGHAEEGPTALEFGSAIHPLF